MGTAAAIALGLKLITLAQDAIAAGQDVSEADIDAVMDEIAASDARLTDAIARRRAREAAENN